MNYENWGAKLFLLLFPRASTHAFALFLGGVPHRVPDTSDVLFMHLGVWVTRAKCPISLRRDHSLSGLSVLGVARVWEFSACFCRRTGERAPSVHTSPFVKCGLTKCALLSYVILFISSGLFGLHICLSYGFSLRGVVG